MAEELETKPSPAPETNSGNGKEAEEERPSLSLDRLQRFFMRWIHRLMPEAKPPEPSPPSLPSKFSFLLFSLKVLPWVALTGYITSLFWDMKGALPADLLPWRSEPINLDGLLRMLSVTALVGFGTNWLAIKMLFYPRKRRPLLGQGLIPSRKDRIVLKLSESISEEIINAELILKQVRRSGLVAKHREKLTNSLRGVFDDQEFRHDLMDVCQHYVNGILRSPSIQMHLKRVIQGIDFENIEGLEGGLLKIYRFLKGNQDLVEHLEGVMESIKFTMEPYEDELRDYLHTVPDLLEEKGDDLEDTVLRALVFLIEQVNVSGVIKENLQNFDEIRLERLLMRSTSDQLQYIQYLGCFLGLLGGLFIWQPTESIVLFGGIGLSVWGLDTLLHRMRGGHLEDAKDKKSKKGKKKKDKHKKNKQPKTNQDENK